VSCTRVSLLIEIFSYNLLPIFGDIDFEDIFSRLPSTLTTHLP